MKWTLWYHAFAFNHIMFFLTQLCHATIKKSIQECSECALLICAKTQISATSTLHFLITEGNGQGGDVQCKTHIPSVRQRSIEQAAIHSNPWKLLFNNFGYLLPQRVGCNQKSAVLVQHAKASEQAQVSISPAKINVTIKSPVGDISVVTLIRTDTTLDHSQKAEKVCKWCMAANSAEIDKWNGHANEQAIRMWLSNLRWNCIFAARVLS